MSEYGSNKTDWQQYFAAASFLERAAMIWPAQVRAARALLGLSQAQLAERAGVGLATVRRVEQSDDEMRGTVRSIRKLQATLEELGVVFIPRDNEYDYGVRLRRPEGSE